MSRLGGKSGGGGAGGAGGGAGRIGVRGPGEKKLETDRRRIRDRSAKFKPASKTCASNARCAARRVTPFRSALSRWSDIPTPANPHCSTLSAGPKCSFRRACSLRSIHHSRRSPSLPPARPGFRTVGFIRDLPRVLLTAFRATLEEVQEAALILHVSDVSNPQHDELDEEVDKILQELWCCGSPKLARLEQGDCSVRAARNI